MPCTGGAPPAGSGARPRSSRARNWARDRERTPPHPTDPIRAQPPHLLTSCCLHVTSAEALTNCESALHKGTAEATSAINMLKKAISVLNSAVHARHTHTQHTHNPC